MATKETEELLRAPGNPFVKALTQWVQGRCGPVCGAVSVSDGHCCSHSHQFTLHKLPLCLVS